MRSRILTVVAVAALVVLAACSGSGGDGADSTELAARLSTAKDTLDSAGTLDIALSTSRVPDGVSGLLKATGTGNRTPAFKGEITVSTGGSSLGADVVAIDGTVWVKSSFSPAYLTVDPADLQAPDPAALLDPDTGVTRILVETKKLSDGGRTRDGSEVLTNIEGTLAGSVVQSVIPSADPDADFSVSYRLTDDDELHDATLSGPFYPGSGDVTYKVVVTASDKAVTITSPKSPTSDE